jgi:tetratricopeptide (TPR) repeat protein
MNDHRFLVEIQNSAYRPALRLDIFVNMKYAFLRTKGSIVIIGLVLGLVVGFKIANSQYRREQGLSLNNAVARAAGMMSNSQSVNSSSSQNLSPEQRNQIINQVRGIIEKAKKNPQDVEAQLEAADQFIQINRPQEALQFLEQAYNVKPNDAQVTAGLGMANFMLGKFDETISWSKHSIAITPKNPGATFLLIAAYIRTNRNLDEADRLIKQLESEGIDKEMIARAREELNAARSTNAGSAGSKSKSMLDHGPQESKPPDRKTGDQR